MMCLRDGQGDGVTHLQLKGRARLLGVDVDRVAIGDGLQVVTEACHV